MRKLLTLLLISMFSLTTLMGSPVNKEKARKVAVNYYMHYAPESIDNFAIEQSFQTSHKGVTTYYTFVFKAGGFVMVAADDAVRPVLGYSHTSSISKDIENPAAKVWFESYQKQIKSIVDQKLDNSRTIVEWNRILNNEFVKNGKSVDPLLETEWGQSAGWDEYVPAGTPVGCVATAMAQVMNYHEHPATGAGWHTYTHPTYGAQYAEFYNTEYNWSNMPDNYGSDASALLSYHCGVAVDMNYTSTGSGAYTRDATYAMANYFKYEQGIKHAELANYSTTAWENLLKSELDASRPILYSGTDQTYGGHAFVCDGYNDSDMFHFNWGWMGSQDGYFAIGALNTYNGDFNSSNSIVYNIQPAASGEEETQWVKKFSGFPNESTYPGYIDAVDANVVWTIGRDGSGGDADYRVFSKTKNGGVTWESGELSYGTAFSMIDGVDANTAFIAAYGSGSGNKIIRTTNGGIDWEIVQEGAGSSSFFNVVHFFNENDGFVQGDPEGGEYELYTTTDGGDNWTRVDGADIPDPESSGEYGITGHYDAIGDNIWYTTNNGYIYRSTDKGYTWTKHQITTGSTYIQTAFANDGMTGLAIVSVVSGGSVTGYEHYKTTDGGQNWTEISPDNFYTDGISYVPGTESTFVSVGADYQSDNMGVSYSTDGGDTWQNYTDYYTSFQMIEVDMVSENKGFAGTFCGEFKSGMWVFGELPTVTPLFSATSSEHCVDDPVTFNNESYGYPDSLIWTFGEGANPATSTNTSPDAVTYETSGEKDVTLTLYKDGEGYINQKPEYIKVYNTPDADFTYEPLSEALYYKVTFTSASSNVYDITQYTWDMGDGTVIEEGQMEFVYDYPQEITTYDVQLKVTNATCYDTITKEVIVDPDGIEALNDFDFNVYPNPADDQVTITNTDKGVVNVYSMDGRLIESVQSNENAVIIDVSDYQKGVYAIKISNKEGVATRLITIE